MTFDVRQANKYIEDNLKELGDIAKNLNNAIGTYNAAIANAGPATQ